MRSLDALRARAIALGTIEHAADNMTVFLANYPSLVVAADAFGQDANSGPIHLARGQCIDLKFKDDVFGFGVYLKQGLFPSSVIVYLQGGEQHTASVSGYMPTTEFVGHVSTRPIIRAIVQPQASGSVEVTGFYIFSRHSHSRDLSPRQ